MQAKDSVSCIDLLKCDGQSWKEYGQLLNTLLAYDYHYTSRFQSHDLSALLLDLPLLLTKGSGPITTKAFLKQIPDPQCDNLVKSVIFPSVIISSSKIRKKFSLIYKRIKG